MSFGVTILGSSSATPTSKRNPSAQVINILGRFFLVDCAEATQIQMRRFKVKFSAIDHIFISHLHGDHYFGLIGFLSSLHLLGRTKELHIYANEALKEITHIQLKHSDTNLRYKIVWHFLTYDKQELLHEDNHIEIYSFPMQHRIPCCGFLFKEKQKERSIVRTKITEYDIPVEQIPLLKKGHDLTLPNGTIIPNKEVTSKAPSPRSYAYCSDTIYDEGLIQYIKNVRLLYHESTFLHELATRAKETYHSTAKEAATIAKLASVQKLIIGHFSARYKSPSVLLDEALTIFPNTFLAEEGKTFSI